MKPIINQDFKSIVTGDQIDPTIFSGPRKNIWNEC